jgi:hypothetical protein
MMAPVIAGVESQSTEWNFVALAAAGWLDAARSTIAMRL